MKHGQHILAFDKARFGIDGLEGFVVMQAKAFFESAYNSLFIGRRAELETDLRFGQLLPYVVLWRKTPTGPQAFVYQRMSTVGEQRLAGKMSVGAAGHVDLADVIHKESVIDIVGTLASAVSRELNEEIGFRVPDALAPMTFNEFRIKYGQPTFPKFAGLINDNGDEVGKYHYGVVLGYEIPDGYEPVCLEQELSTVGMVPVALALEKGGDQLERWSQIVLQNFDRIVGA